MKKQHFDLIELYAGLGAVSLAAVGASPPPVSRVGNKTGYTKPILQALGIEPGSARSVLLVDVDLHVVKVLQALWVAPPWSRKAFVERLRRMAEGEPRRVWEAARAAKAARAATPLDAAAWLLWTAGARGGIGGFKGAHSRRPNMDGFIPSRASLIERVASFHVPEGVNVEVQWVSAAALDPRAFAPCAVYLDPPYADSKLLRVALHPLVQIAERWRQAGHRVVLSERQRLPGLSEADWQARRITDERVGQRRRSLTTSNEEWLFIGRVAQKGQRP